MEGLKVMRVLAKTEQARNSTTVIFGNYHLITKMYYSMIKYVSYLMLGLEIVRHEMISYTRHARDRMQERGITEEEVEYCLDNYHTFYTDFGGNPIYKADLPGGRRIKVVVKAKSVDPIVVITVAD